MTVVAPRKRRIKKATGYKMPIDIERDLNALVENGEYTSRAEAMSVAVRFWLEYRHFDVKAAVREYLQSDEGRGLIAEITKKRRSK